ncbi:hypothetical protein L1887_11315 [Cichorium endivia]|nr:hypothetical protein L1887_11315 [Cichorium endivia]
MLIVVMENTSNKVCSEKGDTKERKGERDKGGGSQRMYAQACSNRILLAMHIFAYEDECEGDVGWAIWKH